MAAYWYPLLTGVCVDTLFAFNEHVMVIWRIFHTLFPRCQIYPIVLLAPADEKHSFSIAAHSLSIE